MSRRGHISGTSPLRAPLDSFAPDQREIIIKKLKEELILARGKEKEIIILENYLNELSDKNRLLSEEAKRKEIDGRARAEAAHKVVSELKRDVQNLKIELRNHNTELSEKENQHFQLKRHLAKRGTQIDKVRKDSLFLQQQNEDLMIDHTKLLTHSDDINQELLRIQSTNRNYDSRIAEIKNKVAEVTSYLGELNDENRIQKQKLRKFEQDNNNISDNVNAQDDNIDDLERVFSEEHQSIKREVDNYIELEHQNQRILTQTRHQINLLKSENDKTQELNSFINRVDKDIGMVNKENQLVQEQIKQLQTVNHDYVNQNQQLTKDLNKCQIHLQNLLKHNAFIQEELEKYLREDEHIINVIRKKRVLPSLGQLTHTRQSRKNTDRTYI